MYIFFRDILKRERKVETCSCRIAARGIPRFLNSSIWKINACRQQFYLDQNNRKMTLQTGKEVSHPTIQLIQDYNNKLLYFVHQQHHMLDTTRGLTMS